MSTQTRKRRKPIAGGVVTDIPVRQRGGEWTDDYAKWKASPGEKHSYSMASPSQASYLKDRYGVETVTRNTHWVDNDDNLVSPSDAYKTDAEGNYVLNSKGNKVKRDDVTQVCDLYVVYDPSTVESNLAAGKAKREAAAKKAAAKKASANKSK